MGGLIGQYQIPYIEISEAIDITTMIVNKYNGRISLTSLATELNQEKTGGGFRVKVTSLKAYGLVSGRGQLVTTDLANRIVVSKDADQVRMAKGQAFLQYPLFNEIFTRLRG